MLLASKVALVTEASRGIGREIALEMAREGADVVVNYTRSNKKASYITGQTSHVNGGEPMFQFDHRQAMNEESRNRVR